MNQGASKTYAEYALPSLISTRGDLSRLIREAEQVDYSYTEMSVAAKTGVVHQSTIALSSAFEAFLRLNQLEFGADSGGRTHIIKQLRALKNKAPVVHMTFAVMADGESLQKLTSWLRESVDKQALLTVGVQPSLVAGVYMRTANKVHDMSLRTKLRAQRSLLEQELGALRGSK